MSPREVLKQPAALLGTGFGSGLAPWAPGTAGTLVAVPIWWALSWLPVPVYLGVVACSFLAGVYICRESSRLLGHGDHPAIVWDEIVGFLVVMTGAPRDVLVLVFGFLVFRFLDIAKPWPVSAADRVAGGFGIMLDDLVAGALGWMLLSLTSLLVHRL